MAQPYKHSPTMVRKDPPSFAGLRPASSRASAAARASSKKTGTSCEVVLRRALWRLGIRFRLHGRHLPGQPDIIFPTERVAVFCDGDFWHGRRLGERLRRLSTGHNAPYWTAKIKSNVARDLRHARELQDLGWTVLRFWETDIQRAPEKIAAYVAKVIGRSRRLNR